ncbi:MAG: heme ABC transporter permease [Acetobacteraceae bacterium]
MTSDAVPILPRPRRGPGLHRFANPRRFLKLSEALLPWLAAAAILLGGAGLVWGAFFSPPDWQQGQAARIMYVHVPAAWLALSGYLALALCSAASLVWRHPLADLAAREIGPVGAAFAAICLASGSLWGRPMWGAWWVWDARLTSMLVLFFLYLGHIALIRAFDDQEHGFRAAAILALIGVVDLPIIHFSVVWWNTLHQGNSISLFSAPSIYISMLWPLILATLGYSAGFAAIVLARLRAAVLERRLASLLLARATEAERASLARSPTPAPTPAGLPAR